MDIFRLNDLRTLLLRHGFDFKKSLGQNFVIERWVPERLTAESGIHPGCGVLEIGPGIGSLTRSLALSAGRVVALELDRRLEPLLGETLAGADNVRVLYEDALRADYPSIVREHLAPLTPVACANLPYYITSPVLERLFVSRLFDRIAVVIQKEAALRITARPGTSEYGRFSVLTAYYSDPEILFEVPAGCFYPRPNVDSAAVLFKMRDRLLPVEAESFFFRVLKAAFLQQRKTLANALTSSLPLKKAEIAERIEACGLPLDVRAEKLPVESFVLLAELLRNKL